MKYILLLNKINFPVSLALVTHSLNAVLSSVVPSPTAPKFSGNKKGKSLFFVTSCHSVLLKVSKFVLTKFSTVVFKVGCNSIHFSSNLVFVVVCDNSITWDFNSSHFSLNVVVVCVLAKLLTVSVNVGCSASLLHDYGSCRADRSRYYRDPLYDLLYFFIHRFSDNWVLVFLILTILLIVGWYICLLSLYNQSATS